MVDPATVKADAIGAWQKFFNFVSAHPKAACFIIIAEAVFAVWWKLH